MTKRALAALALTLCIAQPMFAGFAEVARAIDAKDGVSRVWIPFLGMARLLVRVASPEGIHDFQLVTFRGADKLDSHDVQRILREKLGQGFSPLVQVRSKKSREWSFIYARPSQNAQRFELVVLAHDDEDTVLIRVDVDAEVLSKEINREPRNVTRVAAR
ncbi:MAG TPA: hypothetical protein VHW00_02690 [Thermoanaerobaculia bacterium]|nr:hypothetical protein [Thermoanaerobaculia bacterium]